MNENDRDFFFLKYSGNFLKCRSIMIYLHVLYIGELETEKDYQAKD